jgi:NTP pyrophosphatase (non-canonical NTP hydrolase)
MSDKDKAAAPSEPAKAAAPPEPAKAAQAPKPDAPKPEETVKAGQSDLEARVPHQQAVAEGVKAAESHRQTTADVVEAGRQPVKAPKPHAMVGKMTKLMDEVAEVAKRHKEETLDLRDKLQELLFDVPADIPGHSLSSVHSLATKIEEGINMLDSDTSVRAPG